LTITLYLKSRKQEFRGPPSTRVQGTQSTP